MKYFLGLSMFIICVSSHASDALDSFNFSAPVVPATSSVSDKQVGMIIYDLNSNQFKGLNNAGGWDAFSVPSGNPVTSNQSKERLERAVITPTSGGTCTIVSQSGTWIASTTPNAGGDCTLNFTAGMFSSGPTCVITPLETGTVNADQYTAKVVSSSSSALRFITTSRGAAGGSTAGFFTGDSNILCMGPQP